MSERQLSEKEAKVMIERWQTRYNTVRPHSSRGYRPPAPQTFMPLPPYQDRIALKQ
ncbi:MAG TPA: integrase core domain-containing protein [Rhizomicrobium sp.]|nr:integrase core domain-containing protein [Rhizomicrobium sp.]